MRFLFIAILSIALSACQNFTGHNHSSPVNPIQKNIDTTIDTTNADKTQDIDKPFKPETRASENHPATEQAAPLATAPETALPGNLWPRFQSGLQLEFTGQSRVQDNIQWYIKNRKILEDSQQRMRYFLFFIMDELEKQDIPFDIALIPLIESQYNPFASGGQPLGLWQFMPGTARRFNLYTNSWYDGRKDPVESTKAVATYFRYLMNLFDNDILLSLAAYNSGEGTVKNAINKNRRLGKPADYWHLDLPGVTRTYIPKMIALAEIFKHPEKYQLALIDIKDQPYFAPLNIQNTITLNQVATALDINSNELSYLNAGLHKNKLPYRPNYTINIPYHKHDNARALLSSIRSNVSIRQQEHRIKPGETLGSIARKYHISVQQLKEWNYLKSDTIFTGKTLLIALPDTMNSLPKTVQATSDEAPIRHKVKSGESLWKIARIYKVKMSDVAEWNNKSMNSPLKTGENLIIYKKP